MAAPPVAAGQPAEWATTVGTRIPVKADARLDVVRVGPRNGWEAEALVVTVSRDDRVVDGDEIVEVIAAPLLVHLICLHVFNSLDGNPIIWRRNLDLHPTKQQMM